MTGYDKDYDPDADFDRVYTLATGRAIAEHLKPDQEVLELGCATGLMTEILTATGANVLGVDRSETYLLRAAQRCPDVIFVRQDFGAVDEIAQDHIVATNVIHELDDPAAFLRHCRSLLHRDGLLHLASQNPLSIHRLVALDMGLIGDLREVSERGRKWGTRRLYTVEELHDLAWEAGFSEVSRQGIMLKPLPNEQMASLSPEVLEGFERAASWLSEYCAVNYLVFRA